MTLPDWVQFGWLTEHESSREEIASLLRVVDRDLRACRVSELGTDWSFAIAYNAALQAASAALAAAGYRATRDSHHYRVIQALEYTIGADTKLVAELDAFRKKRNIANYEFSGAISEKEASRMKALAANLRGEVERWIRKEHPELMK